MIPLFCILMSRKTTTAYEAVFVYIMTDFELALMNTAKNFWVLAIIIGYIIYINSYTLTYVCNHFILYISVGLIKVLKNAHHNFEVAKKFGHNTQPGTAADVLRQTKI